VNIVTLRPLSSHRTPLRSDTLFGIICWGIKIIWDEKKLLETLKQFQEKNPPFIISSAFPYANIDNKISYFFPKPFFKPFKLNPEELNPETMSDFKRYKKIRFFPYEIFLKLIQNKITEKEFFLNHKIEWLKFSTALYRNIIVLHNSIDRLSGSSLKEGGLFMSEDTFYLTNNGLFFLLEIYNNEYENILKSVFSFLEHNGLGADSSTGKGNFKINIENFNGFPQYEKYDRFITLSLYYPSNDERSFFRENSEKLWYNTEQRKGKVGGKLFVTNNIIKKRLTMFSEGSGFPKMNKQFYGENIMVKNVPTLPHKIYHYGYAFIVPSIQ